MGKLTSEQYRALTIASTMALRLTDPKQVAFGMGIDRDDPLCKSYRVWNQLAALGLMARFDQSEQVRGEPRQYYSQYSITPAGRAALESKEPGKP